MPILSKYVVCMWHKSGCVLMGTLTPSISICFVYPSKNLCHIQCSFVAGFITNITLLFTSFFLIDKSILSNVSSLSNSSASSSIQVLTPCNDLRLAVWFPELVLIPLKIISDLVRLFTIASLVTSKSPPTSNSSIFSINSGIILSPALDIV